MFLLQQLQPLDEGCSVNQLLCVKGTLGVFSLEPPYLSAHSPRCQHVAAEVELVGLHLVIAGAAVVGNGVDVRRTLEHLDVMHDGLVTRSYHRLVLADV